MILLLNRKYNDTVSLCLKIREAKGGNGPGDIWGTTVRDKDEELKTFWESMVLWNIGWGITRGGCGAYLVTLTDGCSFLCVSGQRGTIAKSMYEEHLCVVALTSNERGTQFISACLLLLCVIFHCSSSTSR